VYILLLQLSVGCNFKIGLGSATGYWQASFGQLRKLIFCAHDLVPPPPT